MLQKNPLPLQGIAIGFIAGLVVGFIIHKFLPLLIVLGIVAAIAFFVTRPKRP